MSDCKQRLYGLGARKMVFHGLGPLGCIPSQRVKSKNGECLHQVNQYVKQFNSRVAKLLVSLNAKLPGAQLSLADSYQIVMDLVVNPKAYGNRSNLSLFKTVALWGYGWFMYFLWKCAWVPFLYTGFKISNTSCCNVDTTVGGLCLPNSNLCSNRRDYVFWDAFHPSDAANQVVADRLFSDSHIRHAPPPSSALAPSPRWSSEFWTYTIYIQSSFGVLWNFLYT